MCHPVHQGEWQGELRTLMQQGGCHGHCGGRHRLLTEVVGDVERHPAAAAGSTRSFPAKRSSPATRSSPAARRTVPTASQTPRAAPGMTSKSQGKVSYRKKVPDLVKDKDLPDMALVWYKEALMVWPSQFCTRRRCSSYCTRRTH